MPSRPPSVRALFGGGDTGGHLYPALAIADRLHAVADADSLFAATAEGLDRRILESQRYPFVALSAGPVRGGSMFRAAAGLARQPAWIAEARRLVRRFRPHIVVGTGGQISGPLLVAATLERVPTLLLELNVLPGLSNLVASRFVSSAAAGWPETAGCLGARAFVSGVPVRSAFFNVPAPAPDGRLGITVIGGSRGSKRLNDAMRAALPRLASFRHGIEITHVTGPTDRDDVRQAYAAHGMTASVHEYVHDMPAVYARTSVVIAHAGGSTCAELAATGRPSILIPLSHGAGHHQTANAAAVQSKGAAVMLADSDDAGERIAAEVQTLFNPERRAEMSRSALTLARSDAASTIVARMLELVDGRRIH
jgi:UDP-N-acetylglucosamine--N-acetylmuramyl-(pentapeptide) pyrophosphoryl-undecaprenol N-acetylglucosamine transferase